MKFTNTRNNMPYGFKQVFGSIFSEMSKSSNSGRTVDHSSHGLDFRVLVIIGGLIIAYQVGLFLTTDDPGYNITDTGYLIVIGLAATFGIIVAKRYRGSEMFSKAM